MGNVKSCDRDHLHEYRKTVRVFGLRKNVFLEFEFTVGFEELTIELVMPYEAFREFCETNHVSKIDCNPEIQSGFNKLAAKGFPKLHEHTENDDNLRNSQDMDKRENIIQLGDFK